MEHWHAVLLLLLTQGVDCSSCLVVYVDADLVDFGDFGSVVDVDYYGDDVADWGEDDDADRLEKGWICHSLKDMRGESWISWLVLQHWFPIITS